MKEVSLNNKRQSEAYDKIMEQKLQTGKFISFEDELRYLNKLNLNDGNFTDLFEHKKNFLKVNNDHTSSQNSNLIKEVDARNLENLELSYKLKQLEGQLEHLKADYKKSLDLKQKFNNELIKIRRENTKEYDNKLSKLNTQERKMKQLKKENNLMINITKLRIVNIDTIKEDKVFKCYLVNTETSTVKYLEIPVENTSKKGFIYWNLAKEFFANEEKKKLENKENLSTINK